MASNDVTFGGAATDAKNGVSNQLARLTTVETGKMLTIMKVLNVLNMMCVATLGVLSFARKLPTQCHMASKTLQSPPTHRAACHPFATQYFALMFTLSPNDRFLSCLPRCRASRRFALLRVSGQHPSPPSPACGSHTGLGQITSDTAKSPVQRFFVAGYTT
jgi:hypothetical protein